MIIKRENIITKDHGTEWYKRTSYWLFGIIPLYIGEKLLREERE